MSNQPCKCGSLPALSESIKQGADRNPIYLMRLVCPCGHSGATLLYAYRHQRQQMAQAAWDGWNLAMSDHKQIG